MYRPPTQVRFLKYIKQWGKKVVFIVNKVDILDGPSEVEEVRAFVADNAARLLGVEAAQVLPVSARQALRAKTCVEMRDVGCGVLNTLQDSMCTQVIKNASPHTVQRTKGAVGSLQRWHLTAHWLAMKAGRRAALGSWSALCMNFC